MIESAPAVVLNEQGGRGLAMMASDRLWNESALESLYASDLKAYQAAVLDQYKIYVEMADRVSQRRGLANTFFLSLNTTVFTLIGVFWKDRPDAQTWWWLGLPLIALIAECFAWFYLAKSYRQLSSAKYEVIGALEERLPASPYRRAEWSLLGEGRDASKYWPLTQIEKWIPVLFACTYLAGFLIVLAS